jgi:hypothetical protein
MNERNSAIGYLLTDRELICVRRIPEERLGVQYGVMDISRPIGLSVPEGRLNAKLALWYLHHRYAVKEPHLSELPRTPKPRNWRAKVKEIKDGGVERGNEAKYRTGSSGARKGLRQLE